eukprot:37042-Eustigmatos_ZCMA.PRE.1
MAENRSMTHLDISAARAILRVRGSVLDTLRRTVQHAKCLGDHTYVLALSQTGNTKAILLSWALLHVRHTQGDQAYRDHRCPDLRVVVHVLAL